MSQEAAQQLWLDADDLPDGLPKVKLLEQAVREADLGGWEEGGFDIRMDLMTAAVFSGASERLLAAFSWCLGKTDEHPERYDDGDLLWQYKWAISSAQHFPGISIEQINNMLDDFSQRLRKHGYALRPAVGLRMRLQQEVGNLEEANELAKQAMALERDDMADCEACEINHRVSLACERGEHAIAMKTAEPLLSGKLSCAEIPHETYPELLISALRNGDMELAKRLHIKGYRLIYRGSDFLRALGMNAIYLARVRDTKKGLDLIQKHIGWALESLEASSRQGFFTGALALARTALKSGSASLPIQLPRNHPAAAKDDPGKCDLRAFVSWLESEIDSTVSAFDQRNGTNHASKQLQEWLRLALV